MKKIVFFSLVMVTLSLADEITTGNHSPAQIGNTPTVNYNPTIYNYNITVATPEEAARLQPSLPKTPTPNPTISPKTVTPPKVSPHVAKAPQPKVSTNSVYDFSIGLQWQDDRDAKTVERDWEGAKSYCENLTLDGYSDWRLPSREELESIVDKSRTPAIKAGFKNIANPYPWYWSASPRVNDDSGAWIVDFYFGFTGNSTKANKGYVRCVRGRQ